MNQRDIKAAAEHLRRMAYGTIRLSDDCDYWRSRARSAESALRTLAEDERLTVGVRNFAMSRLPEGQCCAALVMTHDEQKAALERVEAIVNGLAVHDVAIFSAKDAARLSADLRILLSLAKREGGE